MKAVVQRVSQAQVRVGNSEVSRIGQGILVFLGIQSGDKQEQAKRLARKIADLRIFPDQNKKMNLSVKEARGEIMVVSQFTICADTKGRRPSFTGAAGPKQAEELYNLFIFEMAHYSGLKTVGGQFGAMMQVSLVNDGPVTLIMEEKS